MLELFWDVFKQAPWLVFPVLFVLSMPAMVVWEWWDAWKLKRDARRFAASRSYRCDICDKPGKPLKVRYEFPGRVDGKKDEFFLLCPACEGLTNGKPARYAEWIVIQSKVKSIAASGRCERCDSYPGEIIQTTLQFDQSNPQRSHHRICASCQAEYARAHAAANKSMGKTDYGQLGSGNGAYRTYLRSPEWGEKRKAALIRAGYRCQLCSDHNSSVQVHHNSYKRLGHEEPEDLVVLCDDCHSRFHNKLPA